MSAKFSVAIVGGGISGATLAVALSKYPDIHFDVYEAASAFEEIGAGVGVFGRSIHALSDMGLIDHLDKICTLLTTSNNSWTYRKADIPEGYDFAQRAFRTGFKGAGNYERHKLLDLLVSLLPERVQKECVHFRKRLVRYEQDSNGITMHFTDGTIAKSDLLIGADGIKSPTRYCLYAEKAAVQTNETEKSRYLKYAVPRWSGMVAYRAVIPSNEVEKELGYPHRCTKDRVTYCGKDAHAVVYPIAMGELINVVGCVSKPVLEQHKGYPRGAELEWPTDTPWVESVEPDEVLKAFDGFETQLISLLKASKIIRFKYEKQLHKCIKSFSRWAIHELDPLPFYTNKRVTLLGDAAHGMQPHQGQGANQAFEDAYTLSLILSSPHATKDNIPFALKAYERARQPRGKEIIRLSAQSGQACEFNKAPEYDDLVALKGLIEGLWSDWVYGGSPKEEAEREIAWMKEIMSFSSLENYITEISTH